MGKRPVSVLASRAVSGGARGECAGEQAYVCEGGQVCRQGVGEWAGEQASKSAPYMDMGVRAGERLHVRAGCVRMGGQGHKQRGGQMQMHDR